MKPIHVVIIDDEPRSLNRLKILLERIDNVVLDGYTTDCDEFVQLILERDPDLIFLDVEMPRKTGLQILQELENEIVCPKAILVTSHDHYAIDAIRFGVFDYLLKPVHQDHLIETMHRFRASVHIGLTLREIQIIKGISKGKNSKEIGEELYISKHTVDTHRRKILEKTECKNAAELVKFAIEGNIV
ncbi:MAG: response regulator transcription factor [Flavobacteriales bacterium]|nr:response regulator transcription factor [Flavobacteriales bacterium]